MVCKIYCTETTDHCSVEEMFVDFFFCFNENSFKDNFSVMTF